uniref:Gustatory receptor n=1 Tax=Acrobeloides nanus TaxID=290746 RepID=A0A914EHJ5_9BILA
MTLRTIFGPFYILASLTGILIPVEKRWPLWKKILTYIPSVIWLILFLTRGIYLTFKFQQSETLTKYWCYVVPCFFFMIHAQICTPTLIFLKKTHFLQTFIDDLTKVSHKMLVPVSAKALILCGIFMVVYLFTGVALCIENLFTYKPDNTLISNASASLADVQKLLSNLQPTELMPTTLSDTIARGIMLFGQAVFPLDIFIIISGAYVSSVTMVIFFLAINGISTSYEKFNKEIKTAINERKFEKNLSCLTEIENRLTAYQKLADTIYLAFGTLMSTTFMFGIIIHGAAQFAMRAYSDNMYIPERVVFVSWTGFGLILIVLSLNRPTRFYKETIETKEILWQESSLFSNSNELLVPKLERIRSRIDDASYGRHMMISVKLSLFSIKAFLFIIMFTIDILVAFWKRTNL